MTVIVGLVYRDGIIIASDSQESDDDIGMKRLDVRKVYDTDHFNFTDAEIVVAGTGASAHIARAAELIAENGYAPHFTTPRSVADIVENSMGQMKERYGEELELELLVGVYCSNCPSDDDPPISPIGLFSVYPADENEKVGVAEPVSDYAAMGSGGLFARYLLNRLHDDEHPTTNLDMSAAIREAVYVIEEVTKVDLWCGGPTQLFCIRKVENGQGYVLERKKPQEIKRIVSDLATKDTDVKQKQRQILIGALAAKQDTKRKSSPAPAPTSSQPLKEKHLAPAKLRTIPPRSKRGR
jgi:20S proteasome alpha/beta subunit